LPQTVLIPASEPHLIIESVLADICIPLLGEVSSLPAHKQLQGHCLELLGLDVTSEDDLSQARGWIMHVAGAQVFH
jgi:hypothetical protein